MSEDTAELYLEKVGGIREHKTITFSKGVSIIRAPNAVGKSSIIKGLELLLLDKNSLEGRSYYMNLFNQDFTARTRVRLKIGDKTIERSFAKGRSGLEPTGDPMTPDGDRIQKICFITPENQLISDIVAGRSMRNYVEQMSQSGNYDHLLSFLNRLLERTQRKAGLFLNKITTLENDKQRLVDKEDKLQSFEEDLADLPEVNSSDISIQDEYYKRWSEKSGEISKISKDSSRFRGQLTQLEYQLNSKNQELEEIQMEINDLSIDSSSVREEMKELSKEKNYLETQKSEVSLNRKLYEEELKLTNSAISKRKKFSQTEECFACGQPIGMKQLLKRQENLRGILNDLGVKETEINGKILTINEKIRKMEYDLQRIMSRKDLAQEITSDISGLERRLLENRKSLSDSDKKLNKLKKEENELGKNIDQSIREIANKRIDLNARISETRSEITTINDNIEQISYETDEFPLIEKKIKFISVLYEKVAKSKAQLLSSVANEFESQVKAIQNDLGFNDLGEISIDTNDYRTELKRKDERGVTIASWPLEALSTSERITLAVAFLIAAKRMYAPDFPFFILDELITSYDPGRFAKIKNYLRGIAPFVIITELASLETQSELEVISMN